MHVVIVGGGFGGIKTALELSKRQVGKITLISDQPYFLHHATLYATATGKSTEETIIPLATFFERHPNIEIVEDFITSFEPHRKLVSSERRDYHYDALVLSLGSTTEFFGIAGLKKHAFGMRSLEEVREFQDHIHESVVRNKLDKEYFIIGAGLTGVEMAGALNEHLKSLVRVNRLKNARPRVTLVEAEPRILPNHSKSAAKLVAKQLKNEGIKILVNHRVTALNGNNITIEGKLYPTTTALWTSGIANNPFFTENAGFFDMADDGRVNVNPFLEAMEDVYVIGDNNTLAHSGMALPAVRQAKHVARNITRKATKRTPLRFRSTGAPMGIPLGSRWGYVEWRGIYVKGRVGAIARRWMELHGYCQLLPLSVALPIWRSHDVSDVDDLF